jgi:iron(III) transport system ATP-binding protein
VVKITDLVRVFPAGRGAIVACDRISIEIPQGRFFTLLGPSGCGKTTTLRCIAGLERPDEGEITLDQVTVYSSRAGVFVPPNQRSIGMVFQSYAIWPHMTVFDNVAFPLRVGRQRRPEAEVTRRVRNALEIVRLAGLEARSATSLSGGQQQRLALARALVREPRVLLLDEPLSNLDAKLREQMRLELRALQRQLGITTIYVTHDQVEALAMSNVVAVMHNGRIVQVGPPRAIYERPQNPFVADFIGLTNLVRGQVGTSLGGDLYRIETAHGTIVATIVGQVDVRADVLVSIRPEDVVVHEARPAGAPAGTWSATVEQVLFLGETVDCRLVVDGLVLRARVHPSVRLKRGDKVGVEFNPERCVAIRPGDE